MFFFCKKIIILSKIKIWNPFGVYFEVISSKYTHKNREISVLTYNLQTYVRTKNLKLIFCSLHEKKKNYSKKITISILLVLSEYRTEPHDDTGER